ncbi:GntR family transcriptional regulator [Pseudooctadecabacter sp.]|uniref:GntR family transcriptional regulator n=1 Tax=Pseudooctadecabacter sp. TaxID=1966338 RepID=UPI0035C80DD9
MAKQNKSRCASDLRARILTLDIAPGADLDEVTLAEEYGMSRTPLREVLHRLAGGGFVRLEENRGAKVTSMDFATMRVFFQTAPLIYCSIVRQAAENRTSEQLGDLRDIQARFAAAARAGDARKAGLLNHDFHEKIGDMAQNPYLFAGLKRMLVDHTRLGQTFFAPQSQADKTRVEKAIEQHDAMISALDAREAGLATDLTLQHWDLSRDQFEKYVRPDPLPLDVLSMKDHRNAV